MSDSFLLNVSSENHNVHVIADRVRVCRETTVVVHSGTTCPTSSDLKLYNLVSEIAH